jgi:DNA-binding GntR family transcriptional regulator
MISHDDDLFESIRSGLPSVTNILHQALRRAIIGGQFAPGERLVEREISQRANVSRTPIREAFRLLEAEGLVRHTPRRGVEVIGLHTKQIEDVFSIRRVLEGLAAERAAVRASREELGRLGAIVSEAESVVEHPDSYDSTQDRFNNLLAKCAHMPLLEGMLGLLQDYLREFRHIIDTCTERRQEATAEHRAIYEALLARDPERARARAAAHIDLGCKYLLAEMEKPSKDRSPAIAASEDTGER